MKKIILILSCLFFFFSLAFTQTDNTLLFFDDFEQDDISDSDTIFKQWTSENTTGDSYWHLIPSGATNNSQCMKFEKSDELNDDWIVTKEIVGADIKYVQISFRYRYYGAGIKPKLMFTNQYNGNASQSNWEEIEYILSENENTWKSAEGFINNDGDKLYFAFRYQSSADSAIFFLFDNFKVESASSIYDKVHSSEHFEFYTSIEEQEDFYNDFVEELEYNYEMYKSIWERPSSNTIFPNVDKIKVFYEARTDIPNFDGSTPEWDCGSFNFQSGELFVSPLDNDERVNYYGTLGKIACNELAQMALQGWMDSNLTPWFSEGFGLFQMGYRPNRQPLLDKLSELGTNEPPISALKNIDDLPMAGNKDLMSSFFQSKALVHSYFYGYWGDSDYKWWQLLKHYYIKDIDRIELLYSTEYFDFYAAPKESPYIEAMAVNMEEQLALQTNRFGQLLRHKVNICIYDNEVGKEINERDDFQALANGADKINTSHLEIGHYGLLNHEFMHMWVNMMSPIRFAANGVPLPGSFLNEGLAESTDAFMTDEEIPWHNYKIEGLYYHYQRKYNRNPTFLEIVDNAEVNEEDGFWVDAYALGEMYWRYMNDKYTTNFWEKVKLFLQGGRDWTVFGGKTTEVEGAEFIYYLKSLVNYLPPDGLMDIPFEDSFNDFQQGWSKPSYNNPDNWQINDGGLGGSNCARFYTSSDLNVPIESWLISPPLNAKSTEQVSLSFDFSRYGDGIELEVFYTDSFIEYTDSTNWTSAKIITMPSDWGWSNSGEITISNPPDTLFIGLLQKSTGEQHLQLYIDNFEVNGNTTRLESNSNQWSILM
jgi:hypothetical protein